MKKIFTICLFICFIICFAKNKTFAADELLGINYCNEKGAVVTILSIGGARYIGATAFLTNGGYYDFDAQKITTFSVGKVISFNLPSQYKATKFVVSSWKKKISSTKPWSNKVVNAKDHDYVMDGQVYSVSCVCR